MTASSGTWTGGWTAKEPVQIGFAWAPWDVGAWREDETGSFACRDLGLDAASGAALGVCHVRVADERAAARWRSHEVDFDLLYVLGGAVTVESDGEVRLERGGAVRLPPRLPHRLLEPSADFEAVRITAPARFGVAMGESPRGAGPTATYTDDGPGSYLRGAGPRSFFEYRDLGSRGPTEDRIHVHVVRATEPGEGTGWHYHTMAQWFMVLRGHADIGLEDRPTQQLREGDAMCVGSGPGMRHNVASFSGDYAVLEMCVPAEYDTIAVERPDGATL